MGLKNELLDLREKLNTAWDSEDYDILKEIVVQWLGEGWTYSEIQTRFQEWALVDETNFNAVMDECGIYDVD